MSNRNFTIQFLFPLEHMNQSIHFQAQVTVYKDFCLVYDFASLDPDGTDNFLSNQSGFPRMILTPMEEEGRLIWVHKDTGRATMMSEIIGHAIEEALRQELVGK